MTTIRDMATKLQLSPSTVSRALNGDTKIKKQTRERIEELAKDMQYKGTGRKRNIKPVIGVICPEIISNNYSCLVESITYNLKNKGYSSIVMITHLDNSSEKIFLSNLFDLKVAGIILVMYNDAESIKTLKEFKIKTSIPIVQISNFQDYKNYDSLMISNRLAAKMAVDHLYQLGHRDIAILSDDAAKCRMDAIIDHLKEMGLTQKKNRIFVINNYRFEEAGYIGLKQIMNTSDRPSAIIATYDYLAIGLLRGCSEMNIMVPDELSVISIDDINTSKYTHIALTTVSMPNSDMGQIASRIMINRIKNIKRLTAIQHVSLDPILIIRESTTTYRR